MIIEDRVIQTLCGAARFVVIVPSSTTLLQTDNYFESVEIVVTLN